MRIGSVTPEIVKQFTDLEQIEGVLTVDQAKLTNSFAAFVAKVKAFLPTLGVLTGIAAAIGVSALIAKLDMAAHDFDYAIKQTEKEEKALTGYKDELQSVEQQVEKLNKAKANGDFTAQQSIELEILQAQQAVLEKQIELYKKRVEAAKDHERVVARESALRLLNPTSDDYEYGSTLERTLIAYQFAKEQLQENPGIAGYERLFTSESENLIRYLETISQLINSLDQEQDKDLIDQLSGKVKEINAALGIAEKNTSKTIEQFREDFKSMDDGLQKAIKNMLKTGDTLTNEQATQLKEWADRFGYSAKDVIGYIAKMRDEMVSGASSDNITNTSIADLATLRDELAKTTEAWEEYQKMLEGGDMGDAAKQFQSAWKKAIEEIDAGRIGSKAVRAAGKLFFSDNMLAEWGYDPNKIASALREPLFEALFGGDADDDTDIGIKFARYIQEHAGELGDALKILSQGDGKFTFIYDSFGKLADSLGIDEAVLGALIDALDAYGVQVMRSTEETTELAEQYQGIYGKYADVKDITERTTESVKDFIKAMAGEGMDEFEIVDVLKTLSNGGVIAGGAKNWGNTVKGVFEEIAKASEKAGEDVQDATEAVTEPPEVEPGDKVSKTLEELEARLNKLQEEPYNIRIKVTDENGEDLGDVVIDSLNVEELTGEYQTIYNSMSDVSDESVRAKNAVGKFIETLAKDHKLSEAEILGVLAELSNAGTIALDVETLNGIAQETITKLKELGELNPTPQLLLDDKANPLLEQAQSLMIALDGQTAHLYVVTHESTVQEGHYGGTTVSESSGGSHFSGKFASGTKDAPEGDALVNEKAPELISDGGIAYIANGGKPGFVHLGKGAVVFNADETKRIFRNKYPDIPIRAYADGSGKPADRASIRERLLGGKRVRGLYTATGTFRCICGHSWTYDAISNPRGPNGYCPKCGAHIVNGVVQAGTGGQAPSGHQYDDFYAYDAQTGGINPHYQSIDDYSAAYDSYSHDAGYKKCPNCGRTLRAKYDICPTCRYNFHTGAIPATTRRPGVLSPQDAITQAQSGGSSGSIGSGGGTSVGGADYGSATEPKKVDWIQVLLNRIQKGVAALEKIATSGFKSLSTRMKAATEEIKGVNKEIEAQQRAAERYMSEAEGVGLSDDLAALVQAGTIDISEYDDETRELIDKYSEW